MGWRFECQRDRRGISRARVTMGLLEGGDPHEHISRAALTARLMAVSIATSAAAYSRRSLAAPTSYSSDQSCILAEERKFRVAPGREIKIRQEMVS